MVHIKEPSNEKNNQQKKTGTFEEFWIMVYKENAYSWKSKAEK